MAIKRIWHGWTTPENADVYWTVLSETVVPGIEAKSIDGYRGIQILRRDHESEVEFVTITTPFRASSISRAKTTRAATCRTWPRLFSSAGT
jgi:hypothetical protein